MVAALVLLVLVAAGYTWYQYNAVDETAVPQVEVHWGIGLPLVEYEWHAPVLGGLLHRELRQSYPEKLLETLTWSHRPEGGEALITPAGYESTATLRRGASEILFRGPAAQWQDELTRDAGTYTLEVFCEKPQAEGAGYGSFLFSCTFTVEPPAEPEPPPEPEPEPVMEIGKSALQQGDIFTLRLANLPDGVQPTASTELGMAVFTPEPEEENAWFVAIPVGNARQPGEYPVQVQAGEQSWEASVTVLPFEFEEQNLIIDVTDPVIGEANSPAAYEEYRQKIPPLFETYDTERYWNGLFIEPTTGWISTQFGMIRYTNGDWKNPRYHTGMDIAAAEGTEIVVPAGGRVVLAEYLLNTGNTAVIEHGGGLKSYYFHMSELFIEADDVVEQGEPLGLVGTTGYSTGPHLHYELRIGNQPVSPAMLADAGAGLYSLMAPAQAGDGEAGADDEAG